MNRTPPSRLAGQSLFHSAEASVESARKPTFAELLLRLRLKALRGRRTDPSRDECRYGAHTVAARHDPCAFARGTCQRAPSLGCCVAPFSPKAMHRETDNTLRGSFHTRLSRGACMTRAKAVLAKPSRQVRNRAEHRSGSRMN